MNCLRDNNGHLVLDEEGRKQVWKQYMQKLLNEENEWDQQVRCDRKEGPACKITSVLRKDMERHGLKTEDVTDRCVIIIIIISFIVSFSLFIRGWTLR